MWDRNNCSSRGVTELWDHQDVCPVDAVCGKGRFRCAIQCAGFSGCKETKEDFGQSALSATWRPCEERCCLKVVRLPFLTVNDWEQASAQCTVSIHLITHVSGSTSHDHCPKEGAVRVSLNGQVKLHRQNGIWVLSIFSMIHAELFRAMIPPFSKIVGS